MQRPVARLAVFVLLLAAPASAQWSTESLFSARTRMAAVTVGDYALFAGGRKKTNITYTRVHVYDNSTGTWSRASLQVPRAGMAATAVGDLAFFAGGVQSGVGVSNVVEIYDASVGPPSDPTAWSITYLSEPKANLAAASVGTKAFFAGAYNPTNVSEIVDIYDASLGPPSNAAAWTTASLCQARGSLTATTLGTKVLFAGGTDFTGLVDFVDIYDDSTGAWSATNLSERRAQLASASAGTRAYFGGGITAIGPPGTATMSDVVDVYDSTTGSWSTLQLSSERCWLSATTVGDKVLFAGGLTPEYTMSAVVDVLDTGSGTWLLPMRLATGRSETAATTLGGKALFGGGTTAIPAGTFQLCPTAIVDVFEPVPASPPSEVVRVGAPANPAALLPGVSGGPSIGMLWEPVVDHTSFAPAATLDFLVLDTRGPINVPMSNGTLLCNVPSGPQIFVTPPGTPFAIEIPYSSDLVGRSACVQGASTTPGTGLELTNALDIVVGAR